MTCLSPGRVHDHKVATRDSRASKPYPQPQSHTPVPFRNKSLILSNVSNEQHTQGVVKRGGATVKWLSPQQSMAKLEGMKRHEGQLHQEEKERILQHMQTQHAPIHRSPNAKNSQLTMNAPRVINVQGTNYRVTSGGSKLLRISGTSTRFRIDLYSFKCSRRACFGYGYTKRDHCQRRPFQTLQEWQPYSHEGHQTRVCQKESLVPRSQHIEQSNIG